MSKHKLFVVKSFGLLRASSDKKNRTCFMHFSNWRTRSFGSLHADKRWIKDWPNISQVSCSMSCPSANLQEGAGNPQTQQVWREKTMTNVGSVSRLQSWFVRRKSSFAFILNIPPKWIQICLNSLINSNKYNEYSHRGEKCNIKSHNKTLLVECLLLQQLDFNKVLSLITCLICNSFSTLRPWLVSPQTLLRRYLKKILWVRTWAVF